mgnify:FL=1
MNHLNAIIKRALLTDAFITAANSFASAQRPTAQPNTPKPAETGSNSYGFGVGHTRDIRNRTFTLSSSIAGKALGGIQAPGNKLSFEADAACTAKIGSHSDTLETESLFSNFSRSNTNVGGGYAQAQVALFDTEKFGGLDPFIRYDFAVVSRQKINGNAFQQAFRADINYNLPCTRKLANFYVEYVRDSIRGPLAIMPISRSFNEFCFELRFTLTRFARH